MPKSVTDLAGRRFSVRLPFGCLGPRSDVAASYAYDEVKGSLKLTARPEQWTKDPAIRALVGSPEAEAIEGFWIPRPWITTDACPVAPAPAPAPAPTVAAAQTVETSLSPFENTVGLVSVFHEGDSRLQQRGTKPYEVIRKTAPPQKGGFRLVLEGRIVEGAAGVIVCRADHPDRPPLCLVRVEFERVTIEGATGELFGEWRS